VPLAALGVLLLAVRALDAVVDPWIGRWVDALLGGSIGRVWVVLGLAALMLVAGLTGLFFPLASVRGSHSALLAWCGTLLVGTYLAYSVASVLHQTWGARLGGGDAAQARWVGWREGAALVGVVLASVLPSAAGLPAMVGVFALALVVALLALTRAPRPVLRSRVAAPLSMAAPWRVAGFRRLIGVFLLNGIAERGAGHAGAVASCATGSDGAERWKARSSPRISWRAPCRCRCGCGRWRAGGWCGPGLRGWGWPW